MPEVLGSCSIIDLVPFYPPPFASDEHRGLCVFWPLRRVRALRIYKNKTKSFRKSDQLFLSNVKNHLGKPVLMQQLSHWIVEAISL